MTGDTFADEKTPQSPVSPVSPTSTDATLREGIPETEEVDTRFSTQPSLHQDCSGDIESAQPYDEKKQRPKLLQRLTEPFRSEPEDEGVTETRTRTLEDTAEGYPRLAAFQSSEANFSLYRSFTYLHSRVLLDLQDEITTLENELDEIDQRDSVDNPQRLRCREIDEEVASTEGASRTRRVILKEIREKLQEYDKILIRSRTLESFQKPSDRNYRSVRRYHHHKQPLVDAETDSIRTKEDIISLHSGREWASFDGGVETMIGQADKVLQKVFRTENLPLQKYFRTPELEAKTKDPAIAFYSSTRIDKLVNILITLVIFCLLVIPVVTMYQLTSTATHSEDTTSIMNGGDSSLANVTVSKAALTSTAGINNRDTFNAVGVLIVFTLLFSAAMSLLTRAARHELFAASAAYCAILVVFIGNFTGPGN
ncbi:hypothetical protein T440DRAFT_423575 [Plenodomus tracheiphilus IPT5]|uniref:DUF6594 domain-containing protein n=1 Tax=Plenodomus tracheiphilus IPT5 TaxID=1408161 RepID=A0A6A7B7L2_9PLEO|nr:hypothetical protein T440DRAFT_423575 [Plenodomus tracheiphilus IPT5]